MGAYLSQIIGTGTDLDPFRPNLADYTTCGWSMVDGRNDMTVAGGYGLVYANPVISSEITAIANDPLTTVLA